MTKITGIEERLHKRADAELEKAVTAAISQFNNTLNKIVIGSWPMHTAVGLKVNKDVVITRSVDALLCNITDAVIAKLTDKYRENTVKEFMEKVDTLHDQIDELRDEIQNQE